MPNIGMPSSASMPHAVCFRGLLFGCALAGITLLPPAAQAQAVTTTVAVGSTPLAVAANPVTNKIYVANFSSNNVTVIDGSTNTTTTVDASGVEPRALAVNPATNKIYVVDTATFSVTVIDGATNARTSIVLDTAGNPQAIAVNPVTNKIYVANFNVGTVNVIDGATNATSSVTVGTFPVAVAVNPVTNRIYVANSGSASVTVIDGATNAATAITAGTDPHAIAVNPVTNKIYVANENTNNVTVIDGLTNITTTVNVGSIPMAIALNSVTNKIFVANTGDGVNPSTVTVIDGATSTTAASVSATVNVGVAPGAVAVNVLTNQIYVANQNSSNVSVIDGATNNVANVAMSNAPNQLAVNPVTNRIYAVNDSNATVTVIDGALNSSATVSVGTNPFSVDVNPATNRIYVANQNTGDVTVIDGTTNSTATVAAGASPQAVAVNPITNKIYVANLASDVTVIDGATNATTSVTAGTGPQAVAVNPAINKIYVANLNSGDVTIIDGATNAAETVPAGANPVAIAVNPVTDKVYVANEGNIFTAASVTLIDGATNAATSIDVGAVPSLSPGPFAVAVNSVTNRIYVADNSGNSVIVIDGATNAITKVSVGTNPFTLAVNPLTNKIYVANLGGNVTVVDGATNATTTVAAGSAPRAVAVNVATNKIYVTNQSGNSVTIIDGATNSTTIVSAGMQPLAVAINPVTSKIYVANYSSANVTVLSEQQTQVNPIITTITALPNNATTDPAQSFQFVATNSAPPPVNNLYFQFDSLQGPWTRGAASTPGNFSGAAGGLSFGNHILYAFATDGEDATSVMFASSPATGEIAAYLFGEQQIPTTTTLTPDVNPAPPSQQVTFTAAVFSSDNETPVGSVSFFEGRTLLQNVVLDNAAHAAFSTASLPSGVHPITAVYIPSASSRFAPSTSGVLSETILTPTSTALSVQPNPAVFGQSVTFTATISFTSGAATPTGMVTFFDGATQLGTSALSASAQATFGTSSLTGGAHSISAKYSGDAIFVSSTSTAVATTVTSASTTTALAATPNPAPAGKPLTLTATVSSAAAGIVAPTGTVTFQDGNTTLGTGSLNVSGVAAFVTSSLAAGSHMISAVYGGDGNFASSTSPSLTETIFAPLDFVISAASGSSTSATVKAGQNATYSLQLSLTGGVPTDQITVTATCAQAPPKSTCSGPAAPVTVTQTAPAILAITVGTTANTSVIPLPRSFPARPPANHLQIFWLFALLFVLSSMLARGRARLQSRLATPAFTTTILLFALVAVAVTGCNGGSMSSPPPVANGTPPGAYTLVVTITATQPVNGATLSHTQMLILNVQ